MELLESGRVNGMKMLPGTPMRGRYGKSSMNGVIIRAMYRVEGMEG